MEEQDQVNIQQDAISVLSLFPTREPPLFSPSLQQFTRLFDMLNCGLCLRTLSIPLLLRCSHRFCKSCLDRYHRGNPKKLCPKCPGKPTNRRQCKTDDTMEQLISLAFGEARKMPRMPEVTEKERQNEVELRRAESQSEIRPSLKTQNAEEVPVVSLTSLKRVKTTDHEEPKPRKRSQKKIKTATNVDPEKDATPSRKSKLAAELRQIKKQGFQIIRTRKKRKDDIVIEIESSEPIDVQEIPRDEFHMEDNSAVDVGGAKQDPPRCSISIIPEVIQIESTRKMPSMRELPREESIKADVEIANAIQEQMAIEEPVEEPPVSAETLAARQILHQQFGSNFLSKIVQLAEFPILMRIGIVKHPNQPFTPQTTFTQIKILAQSPITAVTALIASDLNINNESVRLFVCEDDALTFIEVNSQTKLHDINNRFWRSFGGFQILELGEYAQSFANDTPAFRLRCASTWQKRILYFTVDYSKIIC